MAATMAPKKTNRGRPRGRKDTRPIQTRIPPGMLDALEALAERNHRTRSQEIAAIIEAALRAADLWPPPTSP